MHSDSLEGRTCKLMFAFVPFGAKDLQIDLCIPFFVEEKTGKLILAFLPFGGEGLAS